MNSWKYARSSCALAWTAGVFFIVSCLFLVSLPAESAPAEKCTVLVVMSYHDDYVWQKEVRQGIEHVLAKRCELSYFNLNARIDQESGPAKAQEAYEIFRRYQPDAVIAAADAAHQDRRLSSPRR